MRKWLRGMLHPRVPCRWVECGWGVGGVLGGRGVHGVIWHLTNKIYDFIIIQKLFFNYCNSKVLLVIIVIQKLLLFFIHFITIIIFVPSSALFLKS